MSTTVSCPNCGAIMRVDQSWCSLCYAQVGEPFDPLTAPFEAVVERTTDVRTAEAPGVAGIATGEDPWEVEAVPPPVWVEEESPQVAPPVPSGIAPAPDAAAAAAPGETDQVSDVDVMLSMLAAEHRAMDPTSAFTDRFEDKSTRIAIMVGGTVVIAAVVFVVLTLLGAIL